MSTIKCCHVNYKILRVFNIIDMTQHVLISVIQNEARMINRWEMCYSIIIFVV